MEYELVVGLEVHIQLNTDTKLFCCCSTKFGGRPNTQVCPICMGLPGSLPVTNKKALELAIMAAIALNCEIAKFTIFERKNYFYPDLPKGYQISQRSAPLSRNGYLNIERNGETKKIIITDLHLEEDTGKLFHQENTNATLIDLNRAGIPLIEIVSEPSINSPEEAYLYLSKLKNIIQYTGVSNCDMEKGELRVDINLSVRQKGSNQLGVKTEIKNLNSFKFASKAIKYEFERQKKILKNGGNILRETRLYDSTKDITEPMRSKEEFKDYRFFPEPDIPPFLITSEMLDSTRQKIPELPDAKKKRFQEQYALSDYNAKILTQDKYTARFFEECTKFYNNPKSISNWIINDVIKVLNDNGKTFSQTHLAASDLVEIIKMCEDGKITTTSGKTVLELVIEEGKSPQEIVLQKGLLQVSNTREIEEVVKKITKENPKAVADYKMGKKTAIAHLLGQIMKATKGRANPQLTKEILLKTLKG